MMKNEILESQGSKYYDENPAGTNEYLYLWAALDKFGRAQYRASRPQPSRPKPYGFACGPWLITLRPHHHAGKSLDSLHPLIGACLVRFDGSSSQFYNLEA